MASLGKDLAAIRKERNISINNIHEATKIPTRLLHSIEDDTIFTDLEENPTYIRSYVRSYAKALSIDEKDIVYALNKREKDAYSGSLQKLLKDKKKHTFEYDEGDEEPEDEKETEMVHDHAPEPPQEKPELEKQEDSENPAEEKEEEIPNVRSVDWVEMGRQFQPLNSKKSKAWLGIVVVFIVLAVGGYYIFYQSDFFEDTPDQNVTETQEQDQPVSTDSLQLNVIPPVDGDTASANQPAELENTSFESVPDTLTLLLYAAYGKLEPVRVYTDIMDNINPYWIEQGQALRFSFVNEIRIRGQYSRMALIMNGHVIQNFREQFYNPQTRLLEIDRAFFENSPKWLRPAPDSLGISAPPPSVIKDRPTFN